MTKTGAVRWETHIRFYTVDCAKAGYLQKSESNWILTEKGEKALKLPPGELIRSAQREYQAWKKARPDVPGEQEEEGKVERQAAYEEAIETARTEIEEHINNFDPYEFQRLVAELLRAMGYHVPFVASPGPDGGVDLLAYKDPLGTTAPRIKVQVKHRDSKVAAKDVRELEGLLRKEGDIGLIVSSGGFSSEAEREIRSSNKHIETMDLQRVITLWQEHYDKLSQAGKALLPLVRVFFLAPAEE
jgi:restriction system protein